MSMKFSVSIVAGAAALVSVAGISTTASAVNMDVTAAVVDSCVLTAQPMAFGNYVNGQANPKDSTADVTYDCAAGLDVTLTLTAGGSTDENNRRMEHATTPGIFLTYKLSQNDTHTTNWGTGAAGVNIANTPGGGVETHTVFGRIDGNQGVLNGNYDDLVIYNLAIN